MGCLVISCGALGHSHSVPRVSPALPGHAIVPAEVCAGTGRDSVRGGLEGGSPAPLLGGCTPSPGPAPLPGQERRGDTAGDTHPEGGSILPLLSHIPATSSRWKPQCQDSARHPQEFGVPLSHAVSPSRHDSRDTMFVTPGMPAELRSPGCHRSRRSRGIHPRCSRFPAFPPAPRPAVILVPRMQTPNSPNRSYHGRSSRGVGREPRHGTAPRLRALPSGGARQEPLGSFFSIQTVRIAFYLDCFCPPLPSNLGFWGMPAPLGISGSFSQAASV